MKYLAITGGVGGAKLALGLAHLLSADTLGFLVNTGDDFTHSGLHISPDMDTLMYTLSGLSNTETGWGRANESWRFIENFKNLGGESWFNLGDCDLAVHVRRTGLLSEGMLLSEVTRQLYAALRVDFPVWPMSDAASPTVVQTDAGELAFQHYFVRERCAPQVKAVQFPQACMAKPPQALLDWLDDPTLAGVIICPSNPYLSVDPILAIPAIRQRLETRPYPLVAVSPIIDGAAVKGPTAKIMAELGLSQDAATIAAHYGDLLDGFILDDCDQALSAQLASEKLAVISTKTLMQTVDDRINLAQTAINFTASLR